MRRFFLTTLLGLIAAALVLTPFGARAYAQTSFTDIQDNWAAPVIQVMINAGVLRVPADGKFRPNEPVTRLDFAVWTARAMELSPVTPEKPPFKDWSSIPADDRGLVAATYQAGLIKGYTDGTFGPNNRITRAELATVFGRELVKLGVEAQSRWFAVFADGNQVPSWALPAAAAVQERVILGEPGVPGGRVRFAPNDTATRAEAVAMLQRFMTAREQYLPKIKPAQAGMLQGPILGAYYVNTDLGYQSLTTFGNRLNLVVYTGYSLGRDGSILGFDSARFLEWLAGSKRHALVMFANFNRADNNAFLQSDQAQQTAINNILALMSKGYQGVNLDFESVDASMRDRYSGFVKKLADALHPRGYLVTVSAVAKTADNADSDWSGVYDYRALGQYSDYVMLMTYDYHWSGGDPGAIAPNSWVEAVLQYATSQMPAGKIVVGLPSWAYDWPDGQSARARSVAEAEALAAQYRVTPVPDGAGETTFQYTLDGVRHSVWYNTGVNLAAKVDLAKRYGVAGVIMWRLGFEKPDVWPLLSAALPIVQ